MARMLVGYYSRSGHTEAMAKLIGAAASDVDGCEVDVKAVGEVKPNNLLDYDAVILGSPTYYGSMAADVKKLLDETISIHGQLAGRVGGAFSSSANVGGGNETTAMDIVKALLIHGMVIPGSAKGDHYGPVSIGDPDDRAKRECSRWGALYAELAVKLHG